ncbi:MAG TPA: hypothetical protein VKP11_05675 [Frankiaceae bacterium]|nr:hypothetical protein [Frankiaceae bacterium]
MEGYPGRVTRPVSRTSAQMLSTLAEALRGQTVAGVRIHEVTAELTDGAENETIARVSMLVDDPQPGRDTWPVATIEAIEWRARQAAWALGIDEWVYPNLVGLSEATEDAFPAASITGARDHRR